MIRKIVLWFIIIFVGYILLIFTVPGVASFLGDKLGIIKFNEFIINAKSTYDKTVTNLPTKEEVLDTYQKAYSGAVEIKENVVDGVNNTKDTIDDIRETLSGAEDTVNEIIDGVEKAKDFIETTSGTLNNAREVINDVSEISENLK